MLPASEEVAGVGIVLLLSSTAENHEEEDSPAAIEEALRADDAGVRNESVVVVVVHAPALTNRHDVARSRSAVISEVPRNIMFLAAAATGLWWDLAVCFDKTVRKEGE